MILSIITINRNNAEGIKKTIESVAAQTTNDFEYIIIDGNSADNSVNIIKQYSKKITYWVSETDSGIYNAMNKGIKKASGDYCLFLNSGDYLLHNNVCKNIMQEINGQADIYYSDCVINTKIQHYPENIDINYLIHNSLNHQNSLIKRELFINHGYYNENLKILSDWEFQLKEKWFYKSQFAHIRTNIALYDMTGVSSTLINKREEERMQVYKTIFAELAPSIMELYLYKDSVYGGIIKRWGDSRVLHFLLKIYRFFIRRLMNEKE